MIDQSSSCPARRGGVEPLPRSVLRGTRLREQMVKVEMAIAQTFKHLMILTVSVDVTVTAAMIHNVAGLGQEA